MLMIPSEELTTRLYQWAVGGKAYPLSCQFYLLEQSQLDNVSPICNEEEGPHEETGYLSDEKFKELIIGMIEKGVRDYRFIGGGNNYFNMESLLDVIARVKRKGSTVSVTSAGVPFSGHELRALVKANVDLFEFSITRLDEIEPDAHSGKEDTAKNVASALETLRSLKDEYREYTPKVCINILLTQKNFNKISNLIRFAHRSKADHFHIQFPYTFGNGTSETSIKTSQMRELLLVRDDLINLCDIYHLEHNLDLCLRERVLFSWAAMTRKEKTIPHEKELSATGAKFKKRFPKMDDSFIRFVTLDDFQPWFVINAGPEGIFVPFGDGYGTADPGESDLDAIWFSNDYYEQRGRLLSRESGPIRKGYPLHAPGEVNRIQKGLMIRWRDASRLQPKITENRENLLAEYRRRELNVKIKMLDKDIQWAEEELKDVKRRIELYSEDKEKVLRLEGSRFFNWYKIVRRAI